MKRLEEIVLKTAANASLGAASDISSSTNDEPAEDVCPRCGGAGFVRRKRPVDDPRFGRAEPCDCVLDEAADVRQARLERLSNIGSLTRFTFDTLVPSGRSGDSDWFRGALDTAREFAIRPRGWLVLTGSSGSGKTHLAAAIANECIALGQHVLFMVVSDFLDHLRASYDAEGDDLTFDRLFDQVRNAPLLVFDDIDAVAPTPWAKEKLFQVINHRYNAMLPTVYTTSERPQQLEERLATRLCDETLSRVCVLEGSRKGAYLEVGGMTRERLADFQFRNFELHVSNLRPEESASLQGAFRSAVEYAEQPIGFCTFMGVSGCGKTHLAGAIANKVLSAGQSVAFVFVPDLLDRLRAGSRPGNDENVDELMGQLREVDLLILDDLAAHHSTPWAEEKLFQIVNHRTLSGRPMVVTIDRPLEEITQVRIMTRLSDSKGGVNVLINAPHYTLGHVVTPVAEPSRTRARRR
jgi:DNA replication protein DnaC